MDSNTQFELRKQEHIRLSLDQRSQGSNRSGWDKYNLNHEAFPEMDLEEVDLTTSFFNLNLSSPIFISSMTAGHTDGQIINEHLAELSHNKQILMGVGSQRRELTDADAGLEWKKIRAKFPKALLMGNIGITQIITHTSREIFKLIDSLEAKALIVHTNPLQEALQAEGTPQFKGGLKSLENLVSKSPVPIVVKEVGCGMSLSTIQKLNDIGVAVVDIAGKSGTHWGRIEGLRSQDPVYEKASESFMDWGYFSLDQLEKSEALRIQKWVSGGVRSGVDAAKALALGASLVGAAKPWLEAAVQSPEALEQVYNQFQLELKTSLFCTGSKTPSELMGRITKHEFVMKQPDHGVLA